MYSMQKLIKNGGQKGAFQECMNVEQRHIIHLQQKTYISCCFSQNGSKKVNRQNPQWYGKVSIKDGSKYRWK